LALCVSQQRRAQVGQASGLSPSGDKLSDDDGERTGGVHG
jgi:hypothetical protein